MISRKLPALRGALALRLFFTSMLLVPLTAPLPGAGGPAGSGKGPAKPYLLFMGANLSVEWQGKLWPVRGVQRNAFVIEVDGKPVVIRDTDLRMKIDSGLQMTTAVAEVADLETERAYTAANDPRGKAEQAAMVTDLQSNNLDLANYNLNKAESAIGRGPGALTPESLDEAKQGFQQALSDQGSEMGDVGAAMSREQDELSRKLFDALSLSFKVSATRPVEHPYLVVIVRFRDKSNDPKTARLMIYAEVLAPIEDRPHTVHLFRGGFPLGYQLESCQIHLYDRGTEIGTNVAPDRVAMTRDEAFQYSVVNYVVRNRGKTLPPAPARAFWPAGMTARLSPAELDRSLYVKVDKEGQASGIFDDPACTRPVSDAGLEAVRSGLCFDPALSKGKPVAGVAAVRLGRVVE